MVGPGVWTCLMSLYVRDSRSQGCYCHYHGYCHIMVVVIVIVLHYYDHLRCRGEEVVRSYRPAQDNQVSFLQTKSLLRTLRNILTTCWQPQLALIASNQESIVLHVFSTEEDGDREVGTTITRIRMLRGLGLTI